MADRLIQLENIHKDYGGKEVLKNINLYVRDKEFVTLLGPSGCGKTTTLRIIGGFETPSAGVVYFDGKKINDVPPHKRPVNTVFQRYALFPHLNVFENVAFGLRISGVSEASIRERVGDMLKLVNLSGYERVSVSQLSGGEQQRVAIARALAAGSRVILADEPTGSLDSDNGRMIVETLQRLAHQEERCVIVVTHDPKVAEAADIRLHMQDGKLSGEEA